ncbi:heme anaerobic degradation radical SAM methyltransferase ChuW/HutW [Deltaproteobacteria bacterium Smac51]|nr:heme anaerobic degradation radical SAM methyltransferase ChuW/HutW [Deltaproteobacteria bacterium Smac51]
MTTAQPLRPSHGSMRAHPPASGNGSVNSYMAKESGDPLGQAFDRKFTIHAGVMAESIAPEAVDEAYRGLLNGPGGPMALYIHIPFCHNHCLYCGFCGRPPQEDLCSSYALALSAEAAWLGSHSAAKNPVRTIYLGGGTPTVLSPKDLMRLMDSLHRHFNLANDCEITLEGRLHDFTPERAQGFLAAGFNRFSIGVQSFNTEIRQRLGRLSDRAVVIKLLENLVATQMADVIIDLIYGLPGQSVDDFVEDLRTAESVGVDGLDTYQLNVFPGSRLSRAVEEGRMPALAPLSGQGRYYRRASEYLLGRKWRQLSLSHFARTHRERNIYNPWAKRKANCLALGAGAGGFYSGWSFYRAPKLEKYLENATRGYFSPDALSGPLWSNEISAFIVEQMEQGFLNYRRLVDQFNVNPEPLKALLKNWHENDLVGFDEEWLTMTLNGRFWGVNLTQAVIDTAVNNIKEN